MGILATRKRELLCGACWLDKLVPVHETSHWPESLGTVIFNLFIRGTGAPNDR